MIERDNSLGVTKRVDFFNYIFDRGLKPMGEYYSPTVMIFRREETPLEIYNSSKREQNIYNKIEHHSLHREENFSTTHTDIHHNRFYSDKKIYQISHTQIEQSEHKKVLYNTDYIRNRSAQQSIKLFFNSDRVEKIKIHNRDNSKVDTLIMGKRESRAVSKDTLLIYQKESEILQTERIKEIEKRVLERVDEKINTIEREKTIKSVSKEERLQRKIEEREFSDRIYTSVMRRWDRELKRKGYLYG